MTSVPSSTRRVASAIAARIVQHSWMPPSSPSERKSRWSKTQTESNPAASAATRDRRGASRTGVTWPSASSWAIGSTTPIRIRPSVIAVLLVGVARAGSTVRRTVRRGGGRCPSSRSPRPSSSSASTPIAAEFPAAQRRLTFGYPCLYVGGNMVSGLFESSWHVKLGPDERRELEAIPGTRTVRADARPPDDRLHPPAAVDHRRRRGDPALGRSGRSSTGRRCRPRSRRRRSRRRRRREPRTGRGGAPTPDDRDQGAVDAARGVERPRRSAHRGGADVLVHAEQVGRVVAALDLGQALVRAARVGRPDPLLALGLEEVGVDADVVGAERLVERLGPGAVGRPRSTGSSKPVMMVAMTAASRWANAVASAGTRDIAPPRTRSWTMRRRRARGGHRGEHRIDRVVVERGSGSASDGRRSRAARHRRAAA